LKKTYAIAVLIILVVSLWMFSGMFKSKTAHTPTEDTPAHTEEGAAPAQPSAARVRITHLVAQKQHVEVVLRGRTEAKRIVDVKAETGGRVIAVHAEKGQRVQKGDLLCELANDGRNERLAQARAGFAKATIDYEGAQRLQKSGLLSATSLAASKSALESSRAALRTAELDVEYVKIRAPFAGFVEDRPTEVGALLERGSICTRLFDEASLLATGQASEREVAALKLDQPVLVQTTTGEQVNGKISFIGRAADPQTRTYRIEALLDANTNLRDGITAQITVPLQEVIAHRITPAVLALDDAGKVGVRIINAEQRVEFHHVTVVRETKDGVWIAGLPNEIDLITVGQEMVADGDKVETSPDNSGKAK